MTAWPLVPIGEMLAPVCRPERLVSTAQYRLLGAHWYAEGLYIKDIKAGAEIQAKQLYRVEAGDFVYNRLFAWKGAFALAGMDVQGCYVSNEFPCFRVREDVVDGRYLWNYFGRETVWSEALGLSSGGTPTSRNRLKEERLLKMCVPLPPLEEQRKIIQRIQYLLERVSEAKTLMKDSQSLSSALERSRVSALFSNLSVQIPERIEELYEVRGGIQKSSGRIPNANPRRYITVAHVQRNRIDTGDPRYFEVSEAELERWRVQAGDVLVIEGNGSADQVGRAALFMGEIEDCVHQNHVIRLRPDQLLILPEYLNAYLNSSDGQSEMLKISRTTSGLYNLSVGRIKGLLIPVPPLEIQSEIVVAINKIHSETAELQSAQFHSSEQLAAIVPSIMNRAFSGLL